MLLQADPTVQYALGHHVGRVLYKDLETKSPYNTYQHTGLPPGPIASPGVASLAAAANPANVPYLYFVASADGHHEFRMTLAEHTNAIRQVRNVAQAPDSPVKSVSKPKLLVSAVKTKSTPAKRASTSSKRTPVPTAKLTSSSTRKTTKHTARTVSAKKKTVRKKPA
jgi:hypothetical protein